MNSKKISEFLKIYYPIILAFICLLYSVSLGLMGREEEAQYSTLATNYSIICDSD